MRSTRWFCAGALAFALATSLGYAQGNGNGHGNGHGKHHDDNDDRDKDQDHDRRWYGDHDRDYHEWYRHHEERGDLPPGLAKRDRLPPGLERQLVRNGTLPPGLRKKYYRCPEELERTLPPPPPDCAHVLISGHIVLLNTRNFQIVDVFHFER
jgi:hypothetical protein